MPNFTILPPAERAGCTVYAADFGFSPENPDNTAALRQAIAYAKAQNAAKLCLAPGVYRIESDDFITFTGFEDFIFDGCGAEIISGTSYFFNMQGCHRMLVTGLTLDIDWQRHWPASLVQVVSNEKGILTLKFLNRTAPESCDICSFNRFDSEKLTPGAENGLEIWVHPHEIGDFLPGPDNTLTLRCTACNAERMRSGEIYLVRHMRQRRGAAFCINDSSHITVTGNTVYSTLGMTHLVGGHSHHLRFDREVIRIRPGSNRYVSTDGDGIHIIRSLGHILVENCDFSSMGDDSVNIHDCNMLITHTPAPDTVLLEGEGVGQPGDLFELRKPDFSPMGTLTLKNIRRTDTGVYELQFTQPLPDEVGDGYILLCKAYCSDQYIIRNNYFHDHRARGLLLQTSHGLVEHNRLENIQGTAIFVMLELLRGSWYEGAGVEDLTIRNNTFTNCNCGSWTTSLDVMAYLPDNTGSYKTFRNITICDNEITTRQAPAVYFSTCDGLTFSGNQISFTGRPSGYPTVIAERSCGIVCDEDIDLQYSPNTDTRRCMPLYAHLY